MNRFIVTLAGLRIQFTFREWKTWRYFRQFAGEKAESSANAVLDVPAVDFIRFEEETARLGGDRALAEYSLLVEPLSNLLLRHERFLFHGAAFLWHGKAFLFTAQSGVGKSTQLRNWMAGYPEEIEVINGDKPVIERYGGGFLVHPSPWTGKEALGGTASAPLGGIICLERSSHDEIRRLMPKEAAYPVFLQFLYIPEDTESVDLVCAYERQLLSQVPVWKLCNTGTPASAELTHQALTGEGL